MSIKSTPSMPAAVAQSELESSHSLPKELEKQEPVNVSKAVSDYLDASNLTVLKYITTSSTCSVYLVKDSAGQYLAAKVIDHTKLHQAIVQVFLPNELAIVQSAKHANIVSTYKVLTNLANHSILISEYAVEGDLMCHLIRNRDNPPNMAQTKKWFLEITNALTYLHRQFIAHRDVKPENVLICQGQSAKLTDFGYSIDCRNEKGEPTLCTTNPGTRPFKAPEVLGYTEPYDARIADSFSLGVTLYMMVTRKYPFLNSKVLAEKGARALAIQLERIRAKQWPKIGPIEHDKSLGSLLSQLLNPEVHERILVAQVASHRWFNSMCD